MSYTAHIENLDHAVAALNHMANHPDFSGKVVNPPVRKAMKSFAESIRGLAPRQALAAARKMRSYARFANFPRLFQRIGFSFKGAKRTKTAEGKAGVNVRFKKYNRAPQGGWVGIGTQDRWIKPHHETDSKGRVLKQGVVHGKGYRGKINPMGFVPAGVARVASSVISTAEAEIKQRYRIEAAAVDGSPFKSY